MLKLRFNLCILFFILSISISEGQFYKRFSIEAGVNRSININTKEIISGNSGSHGFVTLAMINEESPSYTNNYGFSLGYRIGYRHNFKIRYSKNTLGSYLDGSLIFRDDTGAFSIFPLRNFHNVTRNKSWGFMYEYRIPLSVGFLPIGLGLERQKDEIDDTILIAPGVLYVNYAIHTALGYVYPLFKYIYISAKAFATKSFANNPVEIHFASDVGMYVPLQIGLELGLRFSLEQ